MLLLPAFFIIVLITVVDLPLFDFTYICEIWVDVVGFYQFALSGATVGERLIELGVLCIDFD